MKGEPREQFITLPFVIAVTMLGLAAVLAGPVSGRMKFQQRKLSVPLRSSLGSLKEGALGAYRVVKRDVLDAGIVDALGTGDYLSWTLEDTTVGPNDPLRFIHLFVTYYTGGANLVPHVPDVCFLGSGYEPAQPHENIEIGLSMFDADVRRIPVRVCTFRKTAIFNKEAVSVVYTFHANGRFAETRSAVREILSDPSARYSYFSKVEVSFPRANRQQTVDGARKLFQWVLPELIRHHWPELSSTGEP